MVQLPGSNSGPLRVQDANAMRKGQVPSRQKLRFGS